MSRQQQIVELQDLIDDLTRMKLALQSQTGANNFSDVVTAYSEERSRSTGASESQFAGSAKQNRKQLSQIRSRIDRLFSSLNVQ